VTLQPDLFLQLAIQRCFRRFVLSNAALGKLPPSPAGTPAEKYLAIIANQDDPDIRAKAVCIDRIGHVYTRACWQDYLKENAGDCSIIRL
jgi:hypothetical protein